MFAGGQRLEAERHVELVGAGDDDGFDLGVGEHIGEVGVGFLRLVHGGHAFAQVVGPITNGVQAGIVAFDT